MQRDAQCRHLGSAQRAVIQQQGVRQSHPGRTPHIVQRGDEGGGRRCAGGEAGGEVAGGGERVVYAGA